MPHLSALHGNLLVVSGSNFGDMMVPFDIRVRFDTGLTTRNSQSLSCQSFDNNFMTTAFLFVFGQRYPCVNAIHIGFSFAVTICFYFL